MARRVLVVQFGTAKTGLTTIGYALYNPSGSIFKARTTSGVNEIGSGTGVYAVEAEISNEFNGIVLWDTGDASIRYATTDVNTSQLNNIQDGADKINLIYNYFRHEKETYNKLFDRIGGLRDLLKDEIKLVKPDNSRIEKTLEDIAKRENIRVADLEKAFKEAAKMVQIVNEMKLPDVKIKEIEDLAGRVESMSAMVKALTKKDNAKELKELKGIIESIENKLATSMKAINQNILGNMGTVAKSVDIQAFVSGMIKENTVLMNKFAAVIEALESMQKELKESKSPEAYTQSLLGVVKLQSQLADLLAKNNMGLDSKMIYGSKRGK